MRNLVWFSLLLFTACKGGEETDLAFENDPKIIAEISKAKNR